MGAAASAVFAAWQLGASRRESRLRATFEHLREIEERVQAVRHLPPTELCAKTRAAYNGTGSWDDDCAAHLRLLDGLELLAMARRLGMLDRAIVDEFLISIVRRELISLSALTDMRRAWGEQTIYKDLGDLLLNYEAKRKTALTLST